MEAVERTLGSNEGFSVQTRSANRRQHEREINLADNERIASALGGGILAVMGLARGGLSKR